jgi:hypothetical protein
MLMLFYFVLPSTFINYVSLYIRNSVTSFVFGSNILLLLLLLLLLLYLPVGLMVLIQAGGSPLVAQDAECETWVLI